MRKAVFPLLCGSVLIAASSGMQAQGLRGTVRSTDGRPLEGAELTIANSPARARTDSLGRYAFPRLAAGRYAITVRQITYTQRDTTIVVPGSGWGTVDLVMSRVPVLAEVRALAMQDSCDPNTLDGFDCRVQAGVGYYRNAAELKELNPQQFATMFHGFPGIRPQLVRSSYGNTWRPGVRPSRCLVEFVNGRPPLIELEWWNPEDVVSVEYYDEYRKIPQAFRRFMDGDGLCDLVVYWLYNARKGETPPSIAEQLAAIPTLSSNELYDAIIRVLRRSPAKDEPRFVTEGHRVTIDFTGLDTAIASLGLDRSSTFAAIERRNPDMTFEFATTTSPCPDSTADGSCRLPAGVSRVSFEEPFADARETFAFLMIVSEGVVERGQRHTKQTVFSMSIERRDGTWMLMRADVLPIP